MSLNRIPVAVLALWCVVAEVNGAQPQSEFSAVSRELTQNDVDAWLDGLLPTAMHAGDIAGAVVIVVKDGKILTERGFGYADYAKKVAVDPATTLFRPGSISKLFTWTAVMQLVADGRIDLDADVSRYLDFRIEHPDRKPITMRHLMTHTAGFEESFRNIIGPHPPPPLGAYLKEWVPERIFDPGTVPAYSNYGCALAGYIVERVSHEPFDAYMQHHILEPLGMMHSTFRQPVPERLRASLSKGYMQASGSEGYFEVLAPGPAGALSATGEDMARFMIAHLQDGQYGNARILPERTAKQMHAIQAKFYPALNGMALGFYEHSRNGHRILAHDGGTQRFHSDLHLFLDDGVGLFISLNSPGVADAAAGIHDALFHGFADRYFPVLSAPAIASVDRATAVRDARLMAGTWEQSRRSASNVLSVFGLLSPVMITANADGTISFPVSRHGVMRWREIAPFLWSDSEGQEKIQAVVSHGVPVMVGFGMAPPAALLRVPAWRSPAWLIPALSLSVMSLLIAGLAWPISALARRRFSAPSAYRGGAALTYHLSRGLGLAAAVLALAMLGLLIYMAGSYDRLSDSTDGVRIPLQVGAVTVFVTGMMAAWCDVFLSWSSKGGAFAKVTAIGVAVSCSVLVWAALAFHVTNFSTHY